MSTRNGNRMNTTADVRTVEAARACGIAAKLGYTVACPASGCALLGALDMVLPADGNAICPVEALAHGDNVVVLWTLDELRRQMEREARRGVRDDADGVDR